MFQPIVALDGREILGYEALVRGPEGSPYATATALFEAARDAGLSAELDTACLRRGLLTARAAGLARPAAVFVNADPSTFEGPPRCVAPDAKVIVELSERGLAERPAELLRAAERVRRMGWGIAVDDVGTNWRSMALMPLLQPDVIKLDRGVVADALSTGSTRVARAARVFAERHGSALLTEGVEGAAGAAAAADLGATLAQGNFFGRPAPLDRSGASRRQPGIRISAPSVAVPATPSEVVRTAGRRPGTASKAELLGLSERLERRAWCSPDPLVVLSALQHARYFSPELRERYADLARGAAFVATFGVGLEDEPAPGVRGACLVPGERLSEEWVICTVGPRAAAALIARDLGDSGPEAERRFEYVFTEQPDIVHEAARSLMLRVTAAPPPRMSFVASVATPRESSPRGTPVHPHG